MNNEQLNEIAEKYKELTNIKKEIIALQEEIKKYEENPIVQKYLELKQILESAKEYSWYGVSKLNDEQILEKAISNVDKNDSTGNDTNNIYVYMATYKMNTPKDIEVPYNSIVADYRLYANIENGGFLVPLNRQEDFEKENIVLYPPKNKSVEEYFNEIRKLFFTTAIKYGQNKALEKIIYKRNIHENKVLKGH